MFEFAVGAPLATRLSSIQTIKLGFFFLFQINIAKILKFLFDFVDMAPPATRLSKYYKI